MSFLLLTLFFCNHVVAGLNQSSHEEDSDDVDDEDEDEDEGMDE